MENKSDGSIILAQTLDGSHIIVIDEGVRQPLWITRRDLHAWVWAQPIAIVTATFCLSESVGWLCWIYGVGRPPLGHWARKLKGEPEPLSPDRDPDEPVPLVDFAFEPAFSRLVARCPAKFPPHARIGGPSGDALTYPSKTRIPVTTFGGKHDLHLLPLQTPLPPPPMSRGQLYDIVWKMDDAQTGRWLSQYGLSRRVVFKIAYESGIGTLGLEWLGIRSDRAWSIEEKYQRMHRRNISDAQRAMLIDLSPVAIEEYETIVRQEDEAAADRRHAKLSKNRAQVDRLLRRCVTKSSSFMERISLGESVNDASIAEKISFSRMAWTFGRLAKARIPETDVAAEWRSIRHGKPTAQAVALFGRMCADAIYDNPLN